ncbi:MAG: DUF4215 domain-containing protein [Myxococcales bacterium]|nr:DUF4215 domain-containing protein [Myxococcales bacterium]
MTTEAHAVEVDLSIFATTPTFPASLFPPVEAPDLRLADGSAAVDTGVPIPNVDDGFAGAAPDLGAYEAGSALPTYGPRMGGPVCGDGVVEVGESCDDGNTTPGDGCNATCQLEEPPGADGGIEPGIDAGVHLGEPGYADGGMTPTGGDGCGCRVPATSRPEAPAAIALALLALVIRRRRAARGSTSPDSSRSRHRPTASRACSRPKPGACPRCGDRPRG